MEQVIITKVNGSTYPIVSKGSASFIRSATQTWELMGGDVINISVEAVRPQKYDIGDKITVFGRTYKLNRLPSVSKTGNFEFNYDLEFEGMQYELMRATYDLTIDTTNNQLQDVQADSLTGDLKRFATVLISNANRVFPNEWALGQCPTTDGDKTLTFGETDNCLSVLNNLCSSFSVEYYIAQSDGVNTIHFVERVGQTFPYTFEFGRGKGLYSLERQNVDTANLITRLKVYGSTSNITHKYRANRLCLPNKSKGQSYIENPDAIDKYGIYEATKYFEDIKPTFNGVVTGLVHGSVLQFKDSNMFDLNEKEVDGVTTKYLTSGVSAKIHFNTGNLAGYEFNIKSYDHSTRTFTLIKLKDERGEEFPSNTFAAFQFSVGDKYKILDVALPQQYVDEAETRLATEGEIYYNQNSQPKVKYGLSVNKDYLKKWAGSSGAIVNIFAPGDYIPIKDDDISVDKSVRVQSLTRNLLDPYSYNLTISDTVSTSIVNRIISEVIEVDKIITTNKLGDTARARNNWRTSQEMLDMVFDPEGDYYTDKIKPNSIDTLALSVGAKSMQFGLTNTEFQPNFEGNKNVIKIKGGVLTHYSIDEQSARSWNLASNTITFSDDLPRYIYAKCLRNGTAGVIVFSEQQIKVEQDPMNYHFWIGVLNSVDTTLNVRSISLSYGFSTVNGKFVRTGRISSTNGNTYFDLDNGEIGGRIKYIRDNGTAVDIQEGIDAAIGDIVIGDENLLVNTELYNAGDTRLYEAQISVNGIATLIDENTGAKVYLIKQTGDDCYYRFISPTYNKMWGIEPGAEYVFSGSAMIPPVNGFTPRLQVGYTSEDLVWKKVIEPIPLANADGQWHDFSFKFMVPTNAKSFYFGFQGSTFSQGVSTGAIFLTKNLMFVKGNKSATYKPATQYVARAIRDGSTEIDGGLILSNIMLLKDTNGDVRAGISGLGSDNISFFGGGTYQDAIADASKDFGSTMLTGSLDKKDGSGHRAFGAMAWDSYGRLSLKGRIEALSGKIGDFDVVGGQIRGSVQGKEKFLLTLNEVPNTPSSLTSSRITAFDSGWGQGYIMCGGKFYTVIDPETGQLLGSLTHHTHRHSISFQLPMAAIINISTGIYGVIFGTPSAVVNVSRQTSAEIFLNGSRIGTVSGDFATYSIPSAGTVNIDFNTSINVELRDDTETTWSLETSDNLIVWYNTPAEKTCIGSDGLYSYFSSAEHIFFKKGYGFAVKGKTDMPGILLSGLAILSGGASNIWGAKKHPTLTVTKTGTGVYNVYHSVGHANYSVQVTPKGTHKVANVGELYSNRFEVRIYETDGGKLLDSNFFFTIMGNN